MCEGPYVLPMSLPDAGSPENPSISTDPAAGEAGACKRGKNLGGGRSRQIGPGCPRGLLIAPRALGHLCLSFSLCHKRGHSGKRPDSQS